MRATIQATDTARRIANTADAKRWHNLRSWGLAERAAVAARAGSKVRTLPAIHRETLAMIADGERVTPLMARSATYALLAASATRGAISRDRRVHAEQGMVLAAWIESASQEV